MDIIFELDERDEQYYARHSVTDVGANGKRESFLNPLVTSESSI